MHIAGRPLLNVGDSDGASPTPSIVIVGGGFAGAALAYHLLRHAGITPTVTIIERGAQLGRGIAYGVQDPSLCLNVPAARMSLDPGRPSDFLEFARTKAGFSSAAPHAFLPRALYGEYVETRLTQATERCPGYLRVIRGEAVAIEDGAVRLSDGRVIAADQIVLATGIDAMRDNVALPDDPRIIDAWDEAACKSAAMSGGRSLLLGSGLSALDVLMLFEAAPLAPPAKLLVLSRHGLLPRPHAAVSGGSFSIPAELGPAPRSLRALVRWGRAVVTAASAVGASWQQALDALRPQLSDLWQGLSPRDRTRFVRLVRPYWEVLRHRAPAEVLARIEARRARNELEVLAGSVLECRARPLALELTLRLRGGEIRRERVQTLVRCLGPALGRPHAQSPLIASMCSAGLASIDPAGLGIATAEHGRLIDVNGRPSEHLFAIGQLCRASRWETTSVPEIVRDAVAIAAIISRETQAGTTALSPSPAAVAAPT